MKFLVVNDKIVQQNFEILQTKFRTEEPDTSLLAQEDFVFWFTDTALKVAYKNSEGTVVEGELELT
jgi:hypothetical protein